MIVCNCNHVTVQDVEKYIELNPDASEEVIKSDLNIGTRCGCCVIPESPIVDIQIDEIIKNLK